MRPAWGCAWVHLPPSRAARVWRAGQSRHCTCWKRWAGRSCVVRRRVIQRGGLFGRGAACNAPTRCVHSSAWVCATPARLLAGDGLGQRLHLRLRALPVFPFGLARVQPGRGVGGQGVAGLQQRGARVASSAAASACALCDAVQQCGLARLGLLGGLLQRARWWLAACTAWALWLNACLRTLRVLFACLGRLQGLGAPLGQGGCCGLLAGGELVGSCCQSSAVAGRR